MFDIVDDDGGGTLDRAEVASLASKLGHVMRARDLVDAMNDMDPEGTGEVTFEMFRNWLVKIGRHWSDLLVLPEGSVTAVRQKAEQLNLLPDDPDGDPALIQWRRLSVLLKLMRSATSLWGKPTEMYGLAVVELERKVAELQQFVNKQTNSRSHVDDAGEHIAANRELKLLCEELQVRAPHSALLGQKNSPAKGSDADLLEESWSVVNNEKEATVRRCFFRPMSLFRVVWDLIQVVLLLYMVCVPASLCSCECVLLTWSAVFFGLYCCVCIMSKLIVLPVRLSFGIDVPVNSAGFWWDVFVDVFFIVDIYINFRTACKDCTHFHL